jgi:negative regulator of flagellin synthesis FlgM
MEEPMKITHNKVGQNVNLTDAGRAEKSDKAKAKNSPKDALLSSLDNSKGNESSRVNLSERAQDIKRAKELAMAAPDVREDKVQRLQKLIDDGKYKVDAKDIADKMVDEESQWS